MGHPKYLDTNFEDKLECSIAMSNATQKVHITCLNTSMQTEYVLFTHLTVWLGFKP